MSPNNNNNLCTTTLRYNFILFTYVGLHKKGEKGQNNTSINKHLIFTGRVFCEKGHHGQD